MKNRKMKKKLSMMLALILLFALAGCSSGKEAEDVSEAAPETGAEAETPKEQEPAGEAKDLSSLTIGLANINERGVFGKLVKQGFEEACAQAGLEAGICGQQFRRTDGSFQRGNIGFAGRGFCGGSECGPVRGTDHYGYLQ